MKQRTWWRVGIGLAIGACCLCAAPLAAQKLQLRRSDAAASARTSVPAKAQQAYEAGVQALFHGDSQHARLEASRAVKLDANFADALALEATADLQQREFVSAKAEAEAAVRLDPSDEKAWVILATAENYMTQYAAAAAALQHVSALDGGDRQFAWQFAYQWARAEAGMGDGSAVLEWTNRAALYAPANFAPLHLLHASALLAAGQYQAAADELEVYLQLAREDAPDRRTLENELAHLRAMTKTTASAAVPDRAPNALAN